MQLNLNIFGIKLLPKYGKSQTSSIAVESQVPPKITESESALDKISRWLTNKTFRKYRHRECLPYQLTFFRSEKPPQFIGRLLSASLVAAPGPVT